MANKYLAPLILAYGSLIGNTEAKVKTPRKQYVKYQSGLKLEVVTNPNDKYCPIKYFKDNKNTNKLVRVNPSDLDKKVSEHFEVKEFARIDQPSYVPEEYKQTVNGEDYFRCIRLNPKLLSYLEKTRKVTGKLEVIHGYRPPNYNSKVEGAKHSTHPNGNAADTKYTLKDKSKKVRKRIDEIFADEGLGIGPTVTHFDVRGKRARWFY